MMLLLLEQTTKSPNFAVLSNGRKMDSVHGQTAVFRAQQMGADTKHYVQLVGFRCTQRCDGSIKTSSYRFFSPLLWEKNAAGKPPPIVVLIVRFGGVEELRCAMMHHFGLCRLPLRNPEARDMNGKAREVYRILNVVTSPLNVKGFHLVEWKGLQKHGAMRRQIRC